MFNNITIEKVNREERHFGFLFMSSLIYNEKFRNSVYSLIDKKLGSHFSNQKTDIFAEISLLRDFWFDLGNHNNYDSKLHEKRLRVISVFLGYMGISDSLVNKYEMFWTGNIGSSKLWYPGKWSMENISAIEKEESILENKLKRLRWACNAKPDVLILSDLESLLIEIKVESGIGETNLGYNQEVTQHDIIGLSKIVIPVLSNRTFFHIMLKQENDDKSLNWENISQLLNQFETNEMVLRHINSMPKPK